MRLSNIREVPLLRAKFLLNQEKGKKGYKSIQPEINKMSEFFGIDFEKRLYKSIFDEIEFKEMKSLQSIKNTKTQYFLQEFPILLYRPNFIAFFSEILMHTENPCSAKEILDSLNKVLKLSYEHQFKILISFLLSNVDRFVSDGKIILLSKCKELEKEGKIDQLSQSTLQTLLLILGSFDDATKNSINFFNYNQSNTEDIKQISDMEKLLEIDVDDSVETEKILLELHPSNIREIFNEEDEKNDLISFDLDEKRIAFFILSLLKSPTWTEDHETQFLSRDFLDTLNKEKKTQEETEEVPVQSNEFTLDLDGFYLLYKNYIDGLDMKKVFSYFDDPSFVIKTKEKFDYFIEILQKLNILTNPIQLFEFIFTKWENELNQIEFLKFLINAPPSFNFSFKNYPNKKIKKNVEINPQLIKAPNNYLIEPWKCIELTEVLLKLSSGNYYVKVKELFEWPIQNIPEIIAMNLISIHPEPEDFLFDELIQEVLNLFLNNHLNSFSVIEEVWLNDKNLVIRMISNMYNSSPDLMNLSRILDITQKLKDSLLLLVNCDDYKFAVNLAILAVKRDFLHVDQWLKERIHSIGDDFIEALLDYIKDNLISHCKGNTAIKGNILEKSQLSLESLAVIFENLMNAKNSSNSKVSSKMETTIREVYNQIFEIFDELHLQPANSEEIEEVANNTFQEMFRGETTVYETIEKLKKYMNSPELKEKEIYSCMIHCLLDEYRFYHQYPEKQLTVISTLFGQIIKHQLIDGMIKTIALKYILEGIKKGVGPMFTFGTVALQQFIEMLPSLPSYLKSLRELKQLKNNPALYDKIHEKLEGERVDEPISGRPNQPSSNNPINNAPNTILGGAFSSTQNSNFNYQQPGSPKRTNQMNLPYEKMQNLTIPGTFSEYVNMGGMNNINNLNNIGGYSPAKNLPQSPVIPNSLNTSQNQGNAPNQNTSLNSSQVNLMKNNFNASNSNTQQTKNYFNMMMGMPNQEEENKSFKQAFQPNNNNAFEQVSSNQQSLNNSLLNSSLNVNNVSNLSETKSPKRAKTKLSRPQQGNTINITEMLGVEQEKIVPPSQDIIDNMKFIFNSMNKNNVPEKANELKQLLSSENIIKWFSNFFVVNRVSAESNNHQSYNELITKIENKELNNYLIKDTIHYIQKLLISDKIDKELKEKSLLKNLGSWLGYMTLSRNKPILAKDLDLKEILIDAYQTGKLTAIVTFISRILEHAAKTKVFHGKNPWMQAILSLLSELNANPHLKPNLTFEIENLFGKLELDLKTYPKSKIFENLAIPNNSPDFSSIPSQLVIPLDQQQHHNSEIPSTGGTPQNNNHVEQISIQELYYRIVHLDNYIIEVLSNLNSNSNIMLSKQDLVTMLAQILYSSIEQIINPVVERAVNISLLTTKELAIKDFLFDNDAKKFKDASFNCIKSLAGSLALVTCKEPLRIEYNNRLKEILQKKKISDETIDAVLGHHSGELLDIGCSYIHNYVIKKAIEKIQADSVISGEIERREKGIKTDPNDEGVTKSQLLPELIRPSQNGLTKEQLAIYDNYKKMHELSSKFDQIPKTSFLNIMVKLLKEPIENANPNKMVKNYEVCMVNIQNISQDKPMNNEEFNEQLSKLEKCIMEYKETPPKTARELAKITFKYLLISAKKKNNTLLNIYITLIKGWIKLQPELTEEITGFLFLLSDIKLKFSPELHTVLIQKELINTKEYEKRIFYYLTSDLTRNQSRELLVEIKDKINFTKILPFMYKEKQCNSFFTLFRTKNLLPSNLNTKKENITDYKMCNIINNSKYKYFKDMCSFAYDKLAETIHPFQAKNIEKSQQKLNTFLSSPFITNNEQNVAFFMIITEFCITKMVEDDKNKDNYSPDDEAKAIYTMLTVSPKNVDKLKIFSNFLLGIFRTLHYDYIKSTTSFNQRPYYKLLLNFIYLLSKNKNNDIVFNGEYPKLYYLMALSDFLRILHPKSYPGFAVAWLDLLSCKYFVCSFLEIEPNSKIKDNIHKYEKYLYLIIDLLTYVSNLSNESLNNYHIKFFIEKVYKFFFVLCYTFPEFISNYYFYLLMTLPYGDNFMQLKNLILSCGPKEIEKANPFAEETKSSQEKRKYAVILFDIANVLQEHGYKALITEYVDSKNKAITEKIAKQLNGNKSRDANYFAINAIVVYWSQKLLKHVQEKKMKPNDITDFYIKLMKYLEPENRDHLINAMLNELRFPSIQTLFFSDLIVFILREIKEETIEEHVIRNMCQRMVYKPIPWGLSLTFAQIMKNQSYKIKEAGYYNNNPQIAAIIQNIFNSAKSEKFQNFI